MKPLNILIDCHVFDQTLQGTTTYIKGLYQEFIKDKTKNFFFVAHHYDLEKEFGNHENVTYLKFNSSNKFHRLLFELPQLIKNNDIDFAHFQYIVPPIKKCSYIVTLHDVLFLDYPKYFPFFYRFSKKIMYKWSARHSEIVLTVSEFSKKRIQHHFKINKIYITPNAVHSDFFKDYDKQEAIEKVRNKFKVDNFFLFVSRWEPRKNHYLLLKVFVESEFYLKYNLVFVGENAIEDKRYIEYYKNLTNEIKTKIFKLKNLDSDDLLLINRAAILSIYPSIAEGFGIPPLESVAANVPTICSNTTAMSDFDFINEGFFDPFDASDLQSKINSALKSDTTQVKKKLLKEKYNWQKSTKQLNIAILENLK